MFGPDPLYRPPPQLVPGLPPPGEVGPGGAIGFTQRLESTKAKIDFYSERLKQLAGSSFQAIEEKEVTSSKPASPPHSSSKERKEDEGEGGGEADRTSLEGLKKDERTKEQMEVGEEKVGEKEDEVTDCVPDSSNAVEAEEEADDEQHSSGSVDEELLDDDLLDVKLSKDGDEEKSPNSSPLLLSSPQHSLVGELMNKFGFSDILEYQEAYRKAVQESRGALEDEEEDGAKADNKEQNRGSLKLRQDIAMSPEQNLMSLPAQTLEGSFERRLRASAGGILPPVTGFGPAAAVADPASLVPTSQESLFAGLWKPGYASVGLFG